MQNVQPDWFVNPHLGQTFGAAIFSPGPPAMGPFRKKAFVRSERFSIREDLDWPVVVPGPIDRWISFELGRLNAGLVVEKKSLARLRAEADPACRTREGDLHPFDRGALERLAAVVTPDQSEALRLPITLIVSGNWDDSAYLTDELAAKALRSLEGFDVAFPFREGRMVLPHSLSVDLARRLGGIVQLAFA